MVPHVRHVPTRERKRFICCHSREKGGSLALYLPSNTTIYSFYGLKTGSVLWISVLLVGRNICASSGADIPPSVRHRRYRFRPVSRTTVGVLKWNSESPFGVRGCESRDLLVEEFRFREADVGHGVTSLDSGGGIAGDPHGCACSGFIEMNFSALFESKVNPSNQRRRERLNRRYTLRRRSLLIQGHSKKKRLVSVEKYKLDNKPYVCGALKGQ